MSCSTAVAAEITLEVGPLESGSVHLTQGGFQAAHVAKREALSMPLTQLWAVVQSVIQRSKSL